MINLQFVVIFIFYISKYSNDKKKRRSSVKIKWTTYLNIFFSSFTFRILRERKLCFFHMNITFLLQKDFINSSHEAIHYYYYFLQTQIFRRVLSFGKCIGYSLTALNVAHCVKSLLIRKWNYRCRHHREKSTFKLFL